MAQKKDDVFQLSLTEMAFTIAFLLLLLLGYLVFKEQSERQAAEAALAQVQSSEQAAAALNLAQSSISAELSRAGASNPAAVISKLVAVEELRNERDQLRLRAEDLDSKLTALTELQQELEKLAKSEREAYAKEKIVAALSLQENIRKTFSEATTSQPSRNPKSDKQVMDQVKLAMETTKDLKDELKSKMNIDLMAVDPSQTIKDVVNAAKSFSDLSRKSGSPEQMRKENSDLRGQVAFLKNKLEARGGRDYPPCWADEKSGKVELLFSVEVKPSSVVVTPAWPPHRETDAKVLPGLSGVLDGSAHTYTGFVSSVQGIFKQSQDQQCRHYVLLKSSIGDAVESDRARLMVENYFYKVEVRR